MKKYLLLTSALVLAACGTAGAQETTTTTSTSSTTNTTSTTATTSTYFSYRDLDPSYDASTATTIALEGSTATVTGAGASVNGSTITIAAEGTYVISGQSEGVQIVVEANDTAKIQIVLNGVTMTNEEPPIYINAADKVFLTLAEGTSNTLTDGTSRADETIDGVIFSRADLTINGNGQLAVNANFYNGIESKDDLIIVGGQITVNAVNTALKANDVINIQGATLDLTAGNDGIKAENEEDLTLGNIYLNPSSITINATGDGIQVSNTVEIAGGTINITNSNEGIEAMIIHQTGGDVSVTAADDGLNASDPTATESSAPGAAANTALAITIDGGTLIVDAGGDGLDSNGSLTINGGTVAVQGSELGGNGAIDADSQPIVNGGAIIAVGTADMAQGFTSGADQASISATVSGSAGSVITIADEAGNVLAKMTATQSFQSVIASAPGMTEGATYIVDVDGTQVTATGAATTGNGGMGGPGGRGGFGTVPGGQMPSMTPPSTDTNSGASTNTNG